MVEEFVLQAMRFRWREIVCECTNGMLMTNFGYVESTVQLLFAQCGHT